MDEVVSLPSLFKKSCQIPDQKGSVIPVPQWTQGLLADDHMSVQETRRVMLSNTQHPAPGTHCLIAMRSTVTRSPVPSFNCLGSSPRVGKVLQQVQMDPPLCTYADVVQELINVRTQET